MATVQTLLAIVGSQGWPFFQMDVKNTFLHGNLQEEVYISHPARVTSYSKIHVCHLQCHLNGMKQTLHS